MSEDRGVHQYIIGREDRQVNYRSSLKVKKGCGHTNQAIIFWPFHRSFLLSTKFGQLGSASTLATLMLIPAILVIATLQRLKTKGILSGGLKG
jgi:hypothetical protein